MTHKKVVAIVQARLGSSRLPLKSLLCLRGYPIIDWVTKRLGMARNLDGIIVAVPDTPLDNVLMDHLRRNKVPFFAGSENDVLERFCGAAKCAEACLVVRVCADNPLISGEVVDQLIDFYSQSGADYAYNHIPRGNLWPDGLGAEIVSRQLLEEIAAKADRPSQREHCLNYIWDNPEDFNIRTFNPKEKWLQRPDIKLDIDSAEDFQRVASLTASMETDCHGIIKAWDAAMQKQEAGF